MFSSVGWGEILILIVAALVILGPERLPGAISWVMGGIRKLKDYANGASSELEEQLGTDFDSFREPIAQLNELRQMTPRAVITKHLFDGDSSTIDAMESEMGQLESSVRDSLSGIPTGTAVPARPAGQRRQLDEQQLAPRESGAPGSGATEDGQNPTAGPPAPAAPLIGRRHDVSDWDAT